MNTTKRQSMVEYVKQEYGGKANDEQYELQMELAIAGDARIRMNNILLDDMKFVLEEIDKNSESQFWRRTLVRTVFALIEAQLSIMRQTAVTWHRLGAIQLNEKDLRKLADEVRLFWNESQIPGDPIRLTLTDNIKFSFRVFGLTPSNKVIDVDTSSPGWQSLLIAIRVRDNLTHPKTEQDLLINDTNIKSVLATWLWYMDLSSRAFRSRFLPDNPP